MPTSWGTTAPERRREKEYVTGFSEIKGGLQRFKLGLHCATLQIAAMVAYVQDNDPNARLVRINGWIGDLKDTECSAGCRWSESELIGDYRLVTRSRVASAVSKHGRVKASSPEIVIRHFWVHMRRKRIRAKKEKAADTKTDA